MKISSEHINNLLAYARERHGAPCRVTIDDAWEGLRLDCEFYIYEVTANGPRWRSVERILI